MSKPAKKSARERLLEHVSGYVRAFQRGESFATLDARTRRLLRAHEREVIDTVLVGVAHGFPAHLVRAAILKRSDAPKAHGPRAAKRGGR